MKIDNRVSGKVASISGRRFPKPKAHCPKPNHAFTLIELLVVLGIIIVIAALSFPVLQAHMENARIEQMRSQFRVLEGALSQYQREFGEYPQPTPTGDNAGNEGMLHALLTTDRGGPFLQQTMIKNWLGDTDGDGYAELLDPWGNPWVYIHPSQYEAEDFFYKFGVERVNIRSAKADGAFANLTSYQLWSAGANKTDETGAGDDFGNVAR